MAPKPLRFDIHFLGAQATTEHCIENYRQAKQALPDDPSVRIVPSYECGDFCSYHSYFFKIPDPEWERDEVGMMRVAFDPAESDRFLMNRPVMEHRKTVDEVSEACSCLYKSPCSPKHFREDCESVYKLAKAAGLTEWICQSLRMSSVHDLPPFPITHQSSAHLALQRPCPPTLERKLAGVKLLAARSITTDTFKIMMDNPPLAPGAADAACHLSSHSRHVFLAHRKLFDSRSCHQLYVTYDVSEADTSDLETLAKELHNTLLDCNVNPIRFDLHFLRPDASTEDCVAHYNHVKQSPPEDPSMRVVPSYVAADYSRHHAFFIKVSSPDWQRDASGLSRVFFEPAGSCGIHDDPPIREAPLSIEQANVASLYLYDFVDVKEDCEVVYELAQAAGLTEW
ncbi:hypothetical protein IWZ01DRAFT_483785 [Phyllosticta capitalensis]